MITQKLIKRRIENFWGYGSFEAPVWFVGMEEGRDPKANEDDLAVNVNVLMELMKLMGTGTIILIVTRLCYTKNMKSKFLKRVVGGDIGYIRA